MASDMKAVITLTADASGVQAGIDRAMGGLNKMTNAVQAFRGGMAGGMLGDLFGFAKGSFDQFSQQIMDASHMFGPLSHSTQVDQAMAQEDSMRKLGKAFDPFVAMIDGINTQAIKDVTDYLIANKEAIGQAMENLAIFGAAVGDVAAQLAVLFSHTVNGISRTFTDPIGVAKDVAPVMSPGLAMFPVASPAVDVVSNASTTATLIHSIYEALLGIHTKVGGN